MEMHYRYLGHFEPEDSEELISIARTTDFKSYEYWNSTLGQWRPLQDDSFGNSKIHLHDVRLEEYWARTVFPDAFR